VVSHRVTGTTGDVITEAGDKRMIMPVGERKAPLMGGVCFALDSGFVDVCATHRGERTPII